MTARFRIVGLVRYRVRAYNLIAAVFYAIEQWASRRVEAWKACPHCGENLYSGRACNPAWKDPVDMSQPR